MKEYLKHHAWNPEVKDALNKLIAEYGKDSESYDPSVYVVSDSDNTISVFDVEHQLAVYQLQVMAFAFSPAQIEKILFSGLSDIQKKRTGCTKDGLGHSYQEWMEDIRNAYTYLYRKYGPFTPEGFSESEASEIHKDPQWMEFAAKMRAMYTLVTKEEDGGISCPWLLAWFSGMTEQEVYDLAYKSHKYYSELETSKETWTSPENIPSCLGVTEAEWICGIQVTDNIRELFRELHDNGIAVWVCSASGTDPIRAAIDCFGLHPYIEGMMAMTMASENGIYTEKYDFDHGYAWLALKDGSWMKDQAAAHVQTQGQGKVTAVENVIVPKKGHGPVAGFGDSSGDFAFCTQFSSMKTAVIFNRADRSVSDGGGLLAELAVYQKDILDYDLYKAEKAGDILYVLQGRDENGSRTLLPERKTRRLGSRELKLFKNSENETELEYMKNHHLSCKEILSAFSLITPAGAQFDFSFGFLNEEPAVQSRK